MSFYHQQLGESLRNKLTVSVAYLERDISTLRNLLEILKE